MASAILVIEKNQFYLIGQKRTTCTILATMHSLSLSSFFKFMKESTGVEIPRSSQCTTTEQMCPNNPSNILLAIIANMSVTAKMLDVGRGISKNVSLMLYWSQKVVISAV